MDRGSVFSGHPNFVPRVSLSLKRETLVSWTLVSTGVESSLYFDPQLGESVIV